MEEMKTDARATFKGCIPHLLNNLSLLLDVTNRILFLPCCLSTMGVDGCGGKAGVNAPYIPLRVVCFCGLSIIVLVI